jgi:chromosome segregation ATPase
MWRTANWSCVRSIALSAAILPLLLAATARADDASEADKLREQLRATVMQLRELQDQQAAAKAGASALAAQAAPASADAGLKAKLAAVRARLQVAQHNAADAAGARADADKAKADLTALQASMAATQAELEKFKGAFSQAADQGRLVTAERDQLKSQLATETTVAQACQAKNERLTTFAEGLLDRYDHVTLGEKLMAREPVIGFTRVHLENIAQEREDTIRSARCDPRVDALPPRKAAK